MYSTIANALCVCLVLMAPTTAQSEEGTEVSSLSESDRAQVNFLFSAMKTSREKLKTGEFTLAIAGSMVDERGAKPIVPVSIRCVFDFPNRKHLFEHKEGSGVRKTDDRYITLDEKCFVYQAGSSVTIFPRNKLPPLASRPFDVRVLGWTTPHEFKTAVFDSMHNVYVRKSHWHSIQTDAKKVHEIVLRWGDPQQAEHRIWLDASKDYVPIRFEYGYRDPKSGKWNTPKSVVKTDWRKMAETWVPDRVTMTEERSAGRTLKRVLDFKWKSINTPVDPANFTLEHLRPPPQTPMVDMRLGADKAINLGPIGQDPVPEEALWRETWGITRVLILSFNVSLLLIIAWLVIKRRRIAVNREKPVDGVDPLTMSIGEVDRTR